MAKKEKAEKGEKPEKGDKPAKADKAEKGEAVQAVAPRLQEKYEKEIRPALQQELGDRNIHAVPKLVQSLERRYRQLLAWSLRQERWVYAGAACAMLGAILVNAASGTWVPFAERT